MSDFGFGALSYGAANVGNLYRALSDDQAHEVLEAAWKAGIRYFDTAPHYGLGLSERRLGVFLATKPRDEYIVSTKVGRLLRANPEGLGRLDTANSFAVPADLKRVWDFQCLWHPSQPGRVAHASRAGLGRHSLPARPREG